jgi:hypothetical protein
MERNKNKGRGERREQQAFSLSVNSMEVRRKAKSLRQSYHPLSAALMEVREPRHVGTSNLLTSSGHPHGSSPQSEVFAAIFSPLSAGHMGVR